jgi:hypothetical protein
VSALLYGFGFERLGVVVGDLYFQDPSPAPGQEGAERGVRLELRMLERGQLRGSIYSAQPIAVGRPIWRVDLLESVSGPPASFDRTHHHPRFTDWEPGSRHFVPELSKDPLSWLAGRLTDVESVLDEAGVDHDEVGADDVAQIRAAAPEIMAAVRRLLDGVHRGELAQPPDDSATPAARVGWL